MGSEGEQLKSLPPGTRIGHYEILSEIAHGGMGIVYRAKDLKLHRDVVLKCPWPGTLGNPVRLARFFRELKATANLIHPHIVPLLDAFEHEGVPWLALQFVDGSNLREVIDERGPLPVIEVLRYGEELASALDAAHQNNILHRDFSPGNIIISRKGWALLTDFGLARYISSSDQDFSSRTTMSKFSLTEDGTAVGTPRYMSPEQVLGKELDHRSDIFALGLVIYEMCAGKSAFTGASQGELINNILHSNPLPLREYRSDVPPALQKIIGKAINKKPEARYKTMSDMARDLSHLRHEVEAAAASNSRFKRLPLQITAALAVFGTLLLLAWLLSEQIYGTRYLVLPEATPRRVTTASGWEGEPAISPDGRFVAYVSSTSGNLDVWLVDVEGHKPIRITDDPGSDSAPAWFPDGKGLAFESDRSGENAIWKTSTLGGSASLVVADAKSPALSPDGQRIAFVRSGPSGMDRIVVAPLSDPSQATFLTGDEDGLWNHGDPAWSPDGNRICYGAHRNLWVVSMEDGKARPLTVDDQMDFEPVWSPDGKYVYFSSYRTTTALWRVAAEGGRPVRVTTGTASESSPSISTDGMRLAYSTSIEDFHLALLDLVSGVEQTLREDCSLQQPAIAPDKSGLLYTADREGMRFDLWLHPLADGTIQGPPRRLTDHPGQASHPVFSPDGNWVAYYRVLGKSRDIWIVPSAGGRPVQFTDDPAPDIQPAWSPDGSLLAFASQRDGGGTTTQIEETFQIWVASIFNGRRIGVSSRITQGDISALAPVFSPDGREIAFIGRKGPESDVWIGPVDGSTPPRRITHGASAERLRWSAARNAVLVSGNWRTSLVTLREVSLEDGAVSNMEPEVVFGFRTIYCNFDISPDGRLLCYMRQEKKGNVWILESEDVSY